MASEDDAEGDDWDDLEVGGEGAYGDTLDSGWMAGLRGQRLLREAETLVCNILLRREDPERPCPWREVFAKSSSSSSEGEGDGDGGGADDEEEDPKQPPLARLMDVKSVRDLWADSMTALTGDVLSALCLRFGPAYTKLQGALDDAERTPLVSDRPFLRRKAWDSLTPKTALPSLSLTSVIDTALLVAFLSETEVRLELLEIQLSRAGSLLDEIRGSNAVGETLTNLLSNLGIPGVSSRQVQPLCQSAMLFARLQPQLPCPLAKLEKYCLARVTRGSKANSGTRSLKEQFRALLRPVQRQLERQLSGMLLESPGPPEVDGDGENEEEDNGDGDDDAPKRRRKKKGPPVHPLVLFSAMPRTSAGGVPASAFLEVLQANHPHLSSTLVQQLMGMWAGGPEGFITAANLEAFFSPSGFSLRVRMPPPLPGFRLKGKLKPTDGCQLIYAACSKMLFARLRASRHASAAIRVPPDVVLFADVERERRLPRNNAAIARYIDDGGRVYVHSLYVLDLFDQDKEDAEALVARAGQSTRGKRSGSSGRPATADAATAPLPGSAPPAPARPSSVGAAQAREKDGAAKAKPKVVSSLGAALATLTRLAPPTVIPANAPFPGIESEAHHWSLPILLKYLREELELPGYEAAFERAEMTGKKFIRMDLSTVQTQISLDHAMHAHKLAAHAQRLRDAVLEKSAILRPLRLQQWTSEHVAGWLAFKMGCHTCALLSLRGDLDGQAVSTLSEAELCDALGGGGAAPTEEAGKALEGLLALREAQLEAQRGRAESKGMVEAVEKLEGVEKSKGKGNTDKDSIPQAPGVSRLKSRRLQKETEDDSPGEKETTAVAATRGEEEEEKQEQQQEKDKEGPQTEEGEAQQGDEEEAPKNNDDPSSGGSGTAPKKAKKKGKGKKEQPSPPPYPGVSENPLAAQVEALTSLLHSQQTTLKELEARAQTAQKEKASAEKRLKQEREASEAAMRGAARALESATTLMRKEGAVNQRVREDEVKRLQSETRDLEREREREREKERSSKPIQKQTAEQQSYTSPSASPSKTSAVNITASPVPIASPPPYKAPSPQAPPPAVLSTSIAGTANAIEMKKNTNPEFEHTPISVKPPSDEDLKPKQQEQSDPLTNRRPLAAASALLGEETTEDASPGSEFGSKPPREQRSMKVALEETAATEIKIWRNLLNRYRHAQMTTLTVPDTTVQLSRVASLWLRLGFRMLDDSRGRLPPPPSASRSNSNSNSAKTSAGTGNSGEVDEEELPPPSVEEIAALQGLRRCAAQLLALQAQEGEVSSSSDSGGAITSVLLAQDRPERLVTKVRVPASGSAPLGRGTSPPLRQTEERSEKADYELSVGLFFSLALVRKLLDRYPDKKEQTHLLFLLTRLREGALPVSELSREGLRNVLRDALSVSLPDWAQFDSLCQRFDPEGRGLVTAPRTLQLFRNLNPLGDGLGPGDAQGLSLLALSVAGLRLARAGKDCHEALVDVVAAGGARVASFAALARGDFDSSPSGKALSTKIFQSDADKENEGDEEGGGLPSGQTKSRGVSRSGGRLADETQLVSDLLEELNRDFVSKLQSGDKGGGGGGTELAPLPAPRRDSRPKDEWRRARPSSTCPLSFLPPTPQNLPAACHLVARGLAVYEGRGQLLLDGLGTLLGAHLTFRRAVLQRMRTQEETREKEQLATQVRSIKSGKQEETGPKLRQHPAMTLTMPQIRQALGNTEAALTSLLGAKRAQEAMRRADDSRIEALERLLAELCGIPVPHGGVGGLVRSQEQVETYLQHQLVKMRDAELVHSLESQNAAYTSSLKEVQASLLSQIRLPATGAGTGSPTKRGGGNATSGDGLMSEMDVMMFRRRVEQAALYLDQLNLRAAAKRRLLQAALQLWQACKELGLSPSKRKRLGLGDAFAMTYTGGVVGVEVEVPLVQLGPEELAQRAKGLQRAVLEDMNRPPAAPAQQLAMRINALRKAMSGGSVTDEDGSLSLLLREAAALEAGLLQANEDALTVTERILEKLMRC